MNEQQLRPCQTPSSRELPTRDLKNYSKAYEKSHELVCIPTLLTWDFAVRLRVQTLALRACGRQLILHARRVVEDEIQCFWRVIALVYNVVVVGDLDNGDSG